VVAVVAVSRLLVGWCGYGLGLAWVQLWNDNYEGGRLRLPGPQFALRVTLQLDSAAVETNSHEHASIAIPRTSTNIISAL